MIRQYIEEQLALHPSITPQDVIKMCFQAAYGAEHLLTDIEKVRAYFYNEWESCSATGEPLAEFIAPDVCRVNLGAWKKAELPPEWLFNIFVQAAATPMQDSEQKFFEYVQEWKAFIPAVEISDGKPRPVHHSQPYRDAERPAYRVISGAFTQLVTICYRLGKFLQHKPIVIAIDGRAASGKTTLAANMKAAMGAQVIHMDDFFLPQELRTAERLATPGGNIHHERFVEEILPNLRSRKPFTHRIFCCQTMAYSGVREIAPADIIVVEGSYSQHPALGKYYDLAVFLDINPSEQMRRIEKRNGTKMAAMFAAKWIPMEELYFNTFCVRKNANLVV